MPALIDEPVEEVIEVEEDQSRGEPEQPPLSDHIGKSKRPVRRKRRPYCASGTQLLCAHRHKRFAEKRATERTPYQIERDPLIGTTRVSKNRSRRKARNGLLQNATAPSKASPTIDTLQRMLRENRRNHDAHVPLCLENPY